MFRLSAIRFSLGNVLILACAVFAGCGKEPADQSSPSSGSPVTGNGVIHGRILLVGNPPAEKIIPGSPKAKDESIVVGASGGLKNVIVFLKDAPPAAPEAPGDPPAVLDQINCVYVPHVLAIRGGQTLRLKSSDALMHNVHLQSLVNRDANYGFAGVGQRDIVLEKAEAPFNVKCDVHPWMSAWIGVFDHPWFAVSAEDGSFTISHVPPGNWTLAAWQEALPQQEQKIPVNESSPTDVIFQFQAP